MLGYKGLAWKSVQIPLILPKPDVVALTGGYRKTPVLQLGADIYCDTALIGTATASPYTIQWANVVAGSYSLTAVATDNAGATTTSAAIPITVNALPTVAITAPTAGAVFPAPANITVAATATDADGTIQKVDFYQGATLIGTATASPYAVQWTNVASGAYSLTAVATDNSGATTTSAAVAITVNALPTVVITAPTAGATFTAPATITVTATAADADGTIAKVDFYQGTTLIGTATASPYTIQWTGVGTGSYVLTAVATDNLGGTTTSTAVPITVNVARFNYFIHPDHLNTPRLVADSSGTPVWKWGQAEPFGVNTPDENPSGLGAFDLPLRLPGQYFDKETNVHYNYFRDYDASIGRYVESDPIGLRGGINTYSYVLNSPTKSVDPTGLLKWSASFDLEFVGWRYLGGGVIGKFELVSECDIDGNQGVAEVKSHAWVNVGMPGADRVTGTAIFVDSEIRAREESLRGDFSVRSLGMTAGPINLMMTSMHLGDAVANNVRLKGINLNAQTTFGGFSDVLKFRLEKCQQCRPEFYNR